MPTAPGTSGRRPDQADWELLAAVAGQAALAVHNAHLAARLVTAADAERQRLERNIHDGVQQQLVAVMAMLRLARRQVHRDAGQADATLTEALAETARVLEDLRELARGIHPSVLTDGGLVEAVRERCTRLPLPVTVTADPVLVEHRPPIEVETAAYFVASEALANVLKHAQATRVHVALTHRDGLVGVEVSDDGRGFVPDGHPTGGLAGIADRVHALGGSLTLDAAPGRGTRLAVTIPVATWEPVP